MFQKYHSCEYHKKRWHVIKMYKESDVYLKNIKILKSMPQKCQSLVSIKEQTLANANLHLKNLNQRRPGTMHFTSFLKTKNYRDAKKASLIILNKHCPGHIWDHHIPWPRRLWLAIVEFQPYPPISSDSIPVNLKRFNTT